MASSALPVASPPTRRASCAACSSRRARRHAAARRPGPSGSSRRRPSTRSPGGDAGETSIRTSRARDLLVIAPLTANTLAKLAHGLADNVLTEAALAHRGPVLVAPAMNARMWEHPATQANVERCCASAASSSIGPDAGRARRGRGRRRPDGRAGGDLRRGPARCSATDWPLRGKRVLVSAGGTREPLDAVRYRRQPLVGPHGRRARGGGAPARRRRDAARRQPRRAGARTGSSVVADADRRRARREALARADADVVVMAAAVADYRPADARDGKRPKDEQTLDASSSSRRIDVLRALGRASAATARCSSASAPSTGEDGARARAGEARRQERSTSSSTTTSPRRASASTPPRTRSSLIARDGEPLVPQGAEGRRSRRRSSTRSSAARSASR